MPDKFNYHISTEQIQQLPGGEKFVAKVTRLVRNPGPNHKLVPLLPVNDIGHEFWGKTEREAYAKAEADVKKWIAEQK
ncbi:MAG: hypothetical protein H0X30_03670 [Anaerolineae bacterium]|nr:hypothetical protein [Anaerolineae bacterium]